MSKFELGEALSPDERAAQFGLRNDRKLKNYRKRIRAQELRGFVVGMDGLIEEERLLMWDLARQIDQFSDVDQPIASRAEIVLDLARAMTRSTSLNHFMETISSAVAANRFEKLVLNRVNEPSLEAVLPSTLGLPRDTRVEIYTTGVGEATSMLFSHLEGSTPLTFWTAEMTEQMRANKPDGGSTLLLPTRIPHIGVQLDYSFGGQIPEASVLIRPV